MKLKVWVEVRWILEKNICERFQIIIYKQKKNIENFYLVLI